MSIRRLLIALLAATVTACGGTASAPDIQAPGGAAPTAVVDEQMELTAEQKDALAEAGFHTDGLLQGLPADCRLAEGSTGSDAASVRQIISQFDRGITRGPLVAVEASDGTTLLAITLVGDDGTVGDAAVWSADADGVVTASNKLAAELTGMELHPTDMTAEAPAATGMAGAVDCSWVVADVTHRDPPEPTPQMRPDLMELEPPTAEPGQLVALHFPQETMRGIAFQLDRHTGDGWEAVAWMTSDGNGGDPETVPAFTEGYAVEDVGVGGPGPDHVRLPHDLAPGEYRICTANAGEEFCAPLEVASS